MPLLTSYRLTQARYQETAFSGLGSMRANGRWHRAGLPIVYTAESPAMALLEVMVHVDRARLLTMEFVELSCRFDEYLVESVSAYTGAAGLPGGWDAFPWPRAVQRIGETWFETGRSVVLAVPSAVVQPATNYLINPHHPDFEKLKISSPRPFEIDARLSR